MVGVVFLTFLVQILVTQYGGQAFKTVPLEVDLWLKIIGFAFSVVIFSELIKLMMRALQGIFPNGNKEKTSNNEGPKEKAA
jgi:Ca2+-transporting ATPase